MHAKSAGKAFGIGLLLLFLFIPVSSHAQARGATVSGTVTGATGKPVADVKVTARNLITGQSRQAQTNAAGVYRLANLPPGKYEISATAVALNTGTQTVTLAAGARQTANFALSAALSLNSLGFSTSQTQGNAKEQALLNKRSHMLQIHQKLGLITAIPMVATVITSFRAHGRHTTASKRDLHIALGSTTAALYFATAYYAIFAPKVAGVKTRGSIRFHKAMMWIHLPGMILTPILGGMAESQLNQGERVHGAAKYHGDVALVTAVAYGLALVSVARPHLLGDMGRGLRSAFSFHHSGARNASVKHSRQDKEAHSERNGSVGKTQALVRQAASTLKN